MKLLELRPCARLPSLPPCFGRVPADRFLEPVELADPIERFFGLRRLRRDVTGGGSITFALQQSF
jgi:hypothetical protein